LETDTGPETELLVVEDLVKLVACAIEAVEGALEFVIFGHFIIAYSEDVQSSK